METLSKLFGSETKVKVMRLFLFNPEKVFLMPEIAERAKVEVSKVRREVNALEKIGLLKYRLSRNGQKSFFLDTQFVYLLPLQNFLINLEPLQPKEIVSKISRIGSIKLVITSGVFIQEPESRIDILVVGDNVKKGALEHTIKTIEAEVGKELRYAYFTTEDFRYRLSMFDKLIRDILDYPHKKILNKLGAI